MLFFQIPIGDMSNFAYLIGDENSHEAVIVDPAWEIDKILKITEENKMKIKYILNTHSHYDHCKENERLAKLTNAKILLNEEAKIERDGVIEDGETLVLGETKIKVIYTPGHSKDGTCFLVEGKLLTGDTLFVGECGRVDLEGSSSRELYNSLFGIILRFEDNIEVYPGHDYGKSPYSTIGVERKTNYVLKPRTIPEFIKFMNEP